MNIKVVLPCVFPNPDPIWMMTHSCKRFGIEPLLFGLGETYAGWLDLKVWKLREVCEQMLLSGYSHILYSDARDAFFLTGLEEIAETYAAMGAPPLLLSAQRRPFCGGYAEWYAKVEWDTGLNFPYIGTPGQLCDATALRDALTHMAQNYLNYPDDDPTVWCSYMAAFPGRVALDHDCRIFMNVGDMSDGEWEVRDGRAYNVITDTTPGLIHFNGGSSDALKGKWEGLEKWWRAFGYTERPPWEEA